VPEHWEVKRLKLLGKLQGGIGFPHDFQNIQDLEFGFYKVGDLGLSENNRDMPLPQHTINKETVSLLGAKVIPRNSILYAKVGAALLLNRRRITNRECCIDNNMTAFVPDINKMNAVFAFYALSILDFKIFVNPGAIPSLSEGYQENLPIVAPPLEEQTTIANFLDKKTAQIDRLQDRINRVIERLKEYRSALITQAVTGKITL
jgi:type I restriction enzyme S subunit